MHPFWRTALIVPVAAASAALIAPSPALASINFATPYLFVAQGEAEKGVSVPLYGGSEREVTYVTVRVYRWVQKGDDPYVLEPAPEVAVFPQMVRLEPGARSDVRLAWARSSAPIDERYYRLVLEEFDRPASEGADKQKAQFGFRVRPRASLPLIVYGRGDVAPAELSASIVSVAPAAQAPAEKAAPVLRKADEKRLKITNTGQTYGRILGVRDAGGKVYNMMVYVLPGATVEVELPDVGSTTGLQLLYSSGRSEHVRKDTVPLRAVPIG